MHDVVEIHGRVVVEEQRDFVEFLSRHGNGQIAPPLDGFHEANGKIFPDSIGELLK